MNILHVIRVFHGSINWAWAFVRVPVLRSLPARRGAQAISLAARSGMTQRPSRCWMRLTSRPTSSAQPARDQKRQDGAVAFVRSVEGHSKARSPAVDLYSTCRFHSPKRPGVIDGPSEISLGFITAETPEEAVQWLEKYKAAGAKQIKIYSSVKPEVVKSITAAAHARGMTVTGHIPEGMTAIEGVNDGMDQINHISYEVPYFARTIVGPDGKPDRSKPVVLELNGPRVKDLLSTLQSHHTVLDPTVSLYQLFLHTMPLEQVEPGIAHLPPQLREAIDSPPAQAIRRL